MCIPGGAFGGGGAAVEVALPPAQGTPTLLFFNNAWMKGMKRLGWEQKPGHKVLASLLCAGYQSPLKLLSLPPGGQILLPSLRLQDVHILMYF